MSAHHTAVMRQRDTGACGRRNGAGLPRAARRRRRRLRRRSDGPATRDVVRELQNLAGGGALEFSLRDLPLDEVLFVLHENRFTGVLDVGADPAPERLFFRLGAVVGISPNRQLDAHLFQSALLELKLLPLKALERVPRRLQHVDAALFASYCKERGLLGEEQLERARVEQRMRRLFLLFDRPDAAVRLLEGMRHLDAIIPSYTDLLPVIAYGMIVRSDAGRRKQLATRVAKNRVRLIAPYDAERNRYGLPPKLIEAIRLLEGRGVGFDWEPMLASLDPATTLGVLLLFDRISMLVVEEHDTADLPMVSVERRSSS